MSLPEQLRRFRYSLESFARPFERTRWGCVVPDKAVVLESCADLTLDELFAAGRRHVQFLDLADRSPALDALGAPDQVDLVMTAPASRPDPGRAQEITLLDEAFWTGYAAIAAELGGVDEDRLADLVARDRHTFVAAGMRMFGVHEDGRLAGNASLHSLESVGHVDNVRTAPAYRRRGIATDSTRAVMRASADAGDAQCVLETVEDGDARRIYERLGFRVVSRAASFRR